MLLIRPAKLDDLPHLLRLAGVAGYGLTTLPNNPEVLRGRIVDSLYGFERAGERPRGEGYLFVLEDVASGAVVGTSGIVSKVGGFEPFYAYKIESTVIQSDVLNVRKEIRFLKLVTEHSGPCEITSLFLHPDFRKDGNGRLLSLARFLFMAEHPRRFEPVVIAELRGVVDDRGCSPFWDALGHHFFDVDFPTADAMSLVNKKFIADLMPPHPVYIPLLPESAQEVIGRVHPHTAPAMRILQQEGFAFCDMVDIFDAGPMLRCDRDGIRAIRQSRRAVVAEVSDAATDAEAHVIARTDGDFRACRGPVQGLPDGVRLTAACAAALGVKKGDFVRFVSMRDGAGASAQ
jgi:arginine N-succinyltransferase